jgi:hypothetical protein
VYTSFRGRYRLVVTRVPARRVRLALCCLYKLTQKLKFPCCFLFMHSKSCGFFFFNSNGLAQIDDGFHLHGQLGFLCLYDTAACLIRIYQLLLG